MTSCGIPFVELYRPTKFDDVVLDEYNKKILQNVINTSYFPNFLFYGPPGTGKTTSFKHQVTRALTPPRTPFATEPWFRLATKTKVPRANHLPRDFPSAFFASFLLSTLRAHGSRCPFSRGNTSSSVNPWRDGKDHISNGHFSIHLGVF